MALRAFLALLRPHGALLAGAAVLLLAAAPAPALAVWLLRLALERLGDGGGGLLPVAAASVGLYVVAGGATLARTAAARRVAWSIASELRRRLHARFLARPADGAVGDRLAALFDEADQVQYGVSAIVGLLKNPIQAALVLGTAAALAPALALAALLLVAPAVAGAALAGLRVRRATARSREARAASLGLAAEQLAAVDTIRAFGAGPGEVERFARRDERDRVERWRLEVERVAPGVVVGALLAAALAGVVAVGGQQVAAGTLDGPTLVAFVGALVLANRPLADLAEAWSLMGRSLAALRRVEAELAAPIEDGPRAVPTDGDLCWDRATVVRGGRRVVDDVTLDGRPGELLALVGPTGAGKTTLLRLALGAIRPDAGSVRVGGLDAADVAPGTVAIAPQDLVLLARSVAENVALGDERPDPARVRAALEAAGAGFVEPERVLEEGGRGLSGGERQRLCLARALYRDARVLLLDEPTGQVDTDTARAIVATLLALRPGRTIVVATHDPEVWAQADRVALVRDGRVEQGGSNPTPHRAKVVRTPQADPPSGGGQRENADSRRAVSPGTGAGVGLAGTCADRVWGSMGDGSGWTGSSPR